MSISADVVVVGAGAAGAAAAAMLGRSGLRVILIDPRPKCPPVFRAEKLEPDHVPLLRKFGLFEPLLPHLDPIREIRAAYDGRVFRVDRVEQYGFAYSDMVNSFLANMPASVVFKQGSVLGISAGVDLQRVRLAGGEELTARLVVLATGSSRRLQESLGLRRRVVQKEQCFIFGFTVAAADGRPFGFDSVTYYPTTSADRIDYLTLFKLRRTMRANLFVFRPASDPWIRAFVQSPESMLARSLPKLNRVAGEYRVVGKVESGCVDLCVSDGEPPPGVVVIGDAFSTACPSTGLGLIKVLTDVDALAECLPAWLAGPGMGREKLRAYDEHPRKRALDERAIAGAYYQRHAASDDSPRWRLHRLRLRLGWKFSRP